MDRTDISRHALEDETASVQRLLARTQPLLAQEGSVKEQARRLVQQQRDHGAGSFVEAFLHTYGLSTSEGIALLCLAEALLRIPDPATADRLIEDSFTQGDWRRYFGQSDSRLVDVSGWAMALTGSVLKLGDGDGIAATLGALVKRSGEPVIRRALRTAMGVLGNQFVMGENISAARDHARRYEAQGYRISYDMLGEGARSEAQAKGYLRAYLAAIDALKDAPPGALWNRPSISVKLSALHPRYLATKEARVMDELLPRVKTILYAARDANLAVSFDAEESHRLEISLQLLEALLRDEAFAGYDGIGWVLQAYQKRALHVAQWLGEQARQHGRRMPVRLVKGAYWDSEIKRAQQLGLENYPVFTRKEHTDLSYLACAQALLDAGEWIYPQFATHNAHTVAAILAMQPPHFEFQRLHGMGAALHDQLVGAHRCRMYAPVGEHKDLLAYLIRRLLENGANSSFVHLLADADTPLEDLLQHPITKAQQMAPMLALPTQLYAARANSQGVEWGCEATRTAHLAAVAATAMPDAPAPLEDADSAMRRAQAAWPAWQARPVAERAAMLRRTADAMQQAMPMLCALCVREAGKTHDDAVAEVREAIDFLRYYAVEAERVLPAQKLEGPTGERNLLSLHGRGVFVCISPWNFPLAIFTGQVAAALVTGNAVLAKPAEQTPRIAAAAVAMLHAAGVPDTILQLACGAGDMVGAALVAHPLTAGVCFTGSTAVAKQIQRALAEKEGPIVPLIAETGGLNAMIVDSSALLEQAVDDILASAFYSAGQRCSALRLLYVQEEIFEPLWALLCGAMDALQLGDPMAIATDIGPVIDAEAQGRLLQHIARMKGEAERYHAAPDATAEGTFVTPHLFAIQRPEQIGGEQFGPLLHVLRYRAAELPQVVEAVHATGYGLTFGLQSRLPSTTQQVLEHVRAGNRYVNRSMTGAVVGVQPFGGEGLSGTGPKAGGPHYLPRFCVERTTTINTAAMGGNIELLT